MFSCIDTILFLQAVLTGDTPGYDADFGTNQLRSSSSLVPPMPVGVHTEQAGSPQLGGASKKIPFYKRRWFLIFQTIACLVGIGLLFVLLYPVVKAIAQHIVDSSSLNVDRVVIAGPTNTSYVLFPRSS